MSPFFFNDPATTEIYTLSLHDALPISGIEEREARSLFDEARAVAERLQDKAGHARSEEHTSELQSRLHLVCRLLLEKKKKKKKQNNKKRKNTNRQTSTTRNKLYTNRLY